MLLLNNYTNAQCDCDPVSSGTTTAGGDVTTVFGGTSLTGGTYHLTGDLTINTSFTFNGVTLTIDPGVRIFVNANQTLTITGGSVFTAYSTTMWSGIRVDGTTSLAGKVVAAGNSTIANADTAIVLNNLLANYADANINNTDFCNNYIGIYFKPSTATHPAIVQGSDFCANDLLTPHTGDYGTGIWIEQFQVTGAGVTIGSGLTYSAGSANSFHDIRTGIRLDRSNATIRNNRFYDIVVPGGTSGRGIWGSSDNNFLDVTATIGYTGAAGNDVNRFLDCEQGIYMETNYNSSIYYNKIENTPTAGGTSSVMQDGIRTQNCSHPYVTQDIRYNTLRNVDQRSILLGEAGLSTVNIHGNEIACTISIPAGTIRRGIAIVNLTPGATVADIDSNQTSNTLQGIAVENVSTNLRIRGNTIEVTYPGTGTPASGIMADNCSNVLIDLYDPAGAAIPNTITGTCSSGCLDQIIGIDIESSTDFRCYRNVVYDCYPGIRAEGSCMGGNFVCNDLNDCTWGFGLKNLGGISPSVIELGIGVNREIFGGYYFGGSTELPSDNAWSPSTGSISTWANRTHAYDDGGGAGPTDGSDLLWYYRDHAAVLDMEPDVTLNTYDLSIPTVAVPSSSLINTPGVDLDIVPRCSFPMPRLEEAGEGGESFMPSESLFANTDSIYYSKMVTDYAEKLTAGGLENPRQHLYEMGAYRLLKLYPDLEWETEATASVVSVLGGSTTASFFQVMDSIHTGAYETASTLLSSISPGSIAEENYYFVLDTYLNGIDSTGHFSLSDEMEPEVRALAMQHTLVAGEAVHIARVMLDTVVEFDGIEPAFKMQVDSPEIFSLYPNPAKEQIVLSGKLLSGDEIRIWTLEGTLLQTIVVRDETTQLNISLLNIQTGTYMLEINRAGLKLHTSLVVKL